MEAKGKIGVFDSGFGGLTILKEILEKLPQYDYVYLGDSARAPYGARTQEEIFEFTKQGIDFLFSQGAEIVILACNTASSEALRKIQQEYLPAKYPTKRVLGVIVPACEAAIEMSKNKKIGVLATDATIGSHAFKRELEKLDPNAAVSEVAASFLAALVEMGDEGSYQAKNLIKEYLGKMPSDIDTLILGCTHYGFLENEIKIEAPGKMIVSEGEVIGQKLKRYLDKHTEIEAMLSKNSSREFFTTGDSNIFDERGTKFFGSRVESNIAHLQ